MAIIFSGRTVSIKKKKSVYQSNVSNVTQVGCSSTVVYYFCHGVANSVTQIVPNL